MGLYNDKRVKAMIYDEPNHWRNLIVDNIHKQAYLIEPQNGTIEIIDYDRLPAKPNDLYSARINRLRYVCSLRTCDTASNRGLAAPPFLRHTAPQWVRHCL